MFILRQINKEGLESNLSLGDHYLITYKENNLNRFNEWVESMDEFPQQKECYAFLSFEKKDKNTTWPLYNSQSYYIMTDSGKTFANVSLKK